MLSVVQAAGAEPRVWVNGTEIPGTPSGPSGDAQQTVPALGADVDLGGYYDGTSFMGGFMGEMLMFDSALVDTDRQTAESYLTGRWVGNSGSQRRISAQAGVGINLLSGATNTLAIPQNATAIFNPISSQLANLPNAAGTIAVLFQAVATAPGTGDLTGLTDGSGSQSRSNWYHAITFNLFGGNELADDDGLIGPNSQTHITLTSTHWWLFVVAWPAGAAAVERMSYVDLSVGTWTHINSDLNGGTRAGPSTTVGQWNIGSFQDENHAVVVGLSAAWAGVALTDTQVEALLAHGKTSDWYTNAGGAPTTLVECTSLTPTDIGAHPSTFKGLDVQATLTGALPTGTFGTWQFDGQGGATPVALTLAAHAAAQATATVTATTATPMAVAPTAAAASQATVALTAPAMLYLFPRAVTATDDFNRADGALGTGWVAGADSPLAIASSQVKGTVAATFTEMFRAETTYGNDQWSEIQTATNPASGDWIGASVRVQNNGQDLYRAIYFNNSGSYELRLGRRVAGTFTTLTTVSLGTNPIPSGTTLGISVMGNAVMMFVGAALISQAGDTAVPSGGVPGVIAFGTSATADNWRGGNSTRVSSQALATITIPSAAVPVAPTAGAASQALAALSATTLLTPSAGAASVATASLTAPAALSVDAAAVSQASAVISPPLVASATAASAATATVTAAVLVPAFLGPTATATTAATAAVSAPGVQFLTADADATAAATATTTAPTVLVAQAGAATAALLAVTADIVTTPVPVAPVAGATSTATVALRASAKLTATAGAVAQASGQMVVGISLNAAATATAAAVATPVVTVSVTLTAQAASQAQCFMVAGAISLVVSAAATAAATASATAAAVVSVSASSQTQAQATLTAPTLLELDQAGAQAAAQAALTTVAQLGPTAQSTAATSLTVGYTPYLTLTATAVASTTGYAGYGPILTCRSIAQAKAVMVLVAPYVSLLTGSLYAEVYSNRTLVEVVDPTMYAATTSNRSYVEVEDPDLIAAVQS